MCVPSERRKKICSLSLIMVYGTSVIDSRYFVIFYLRFELFVMYCLQHVMCGLFLTSFGTIIQYYKEG
ncbi:hypothetical protein MtrunA17_Chr1g0189291 [Medicago truncatula]|uniref:Transmembrane protein n=1 Tax=Medicago truncatula TaxID=3880 RepID=A0A396JQH8_MEDTR|nr:hypothetical protein MtrunA17_Chr1g0189291 [Medicago truncatula]